MQKTKDKLKEVFLWWNTISEVEKALIITYAYESEVVLKKGLKKYNDSTDKIINWWESLSKENQVILITYAYNNKIELK